MTLVKTLCTTALLLSVSLIATSVTAAEDVKFAYRQVDKTLTITGTSCSYGRGSKAQLPTKIKTNIHNFVRGNKPAFVKQIKDINKGMAGRRLVTAELAVFYLLDLDKMNIDYQFVGNDVCGNYDAEIELDFEQEFSPFVTTTDIDEYYFVAKSNDNSGIHKALTDQFSKVNLDSIKPYVSLVEETGQGYNLYKFDHKSFKENNELFKKQVFITGEELYKFGLSDYLKKSGYSIVDSNQTSYWQVEIKPSNYPHFTIVINNNDGHFKAFDSTRFPVPPFSTNTDIEKRKLIQFQLTMMKLTEKL